MKTRDELPTDHANSDRLRAWEHSRTSWPAARPPQVRLARPPTVENSPQNTCTILSPYVWKPVCVGTITLKADFH